MTKYKIDFHLIMLLNKKTFAFFPFASRYEHYFF